MRSSRSTTTFVVLAATGVAACLLFGAAAPAAAAEPGEILVSADGVTFAKNLDHGLFDRSGCSFPAAPSIPRCGSRTAVTLPQSFG